MDATGANAIGKKNGIPKCSQQTTIDLLARQIWKASEIFNRYVTEGRALHIKKTNTIL